MTAGMREGNANNFGLGHRKRLALLLGPALALTLLAGCSSDKTEQSLDKLRETVLFGISKEEREQIAADAQAKAASAPVQVDYESLPCPPAEISTSATHYTISARDEIPDAKSIRYQGTLNRVSRECHFSPDGFKMKIGFAGRVLLGPKGGEGKVTLPVKAELIATGERVVWSKVYKLDVALGPGQTSVPFVHVADDLAYQPKSGEFLQDFRLVVGYEVPEQR